LVASRQRRIADAAIKQRELYERERAIADKLRDAIIVADLVRVPELSIHARYRPADELERVGGDWYDLFPLANGRLLVVVGDVVGHGIDATLSMSRVRNAIIAGSLQASHPGDVLTAANRQLLTRDSAEMIGTAVCAFLDPATGEVQCACAGHPPPLLLTPDVPPQWMSKGGLPLGFEDCQYSTITAHAQAGTLIVFYTDGLTETTHNVVDGENHLIHAARDALAVFGTVVFIARLWRLDVDQMHSMVFLALVAMGQIAVFVVRERSSLFGLRPSPWLLGTTAFALLAATAMALYGILMPALPASSILTTLALLCAAGLVLNVLKVPILASFGSRGGRF
jgi:hypothetical protein